MPPQSEIPNPKSEIPDRGHLLTEQRLDAAAELDAMSVEQTLQLINEQDATIAAVVRAAIPRIAKLVERIVAAMREGGRLIYLGAGTSGRLGVLDASECPPTFHCDPSQVVGVIAGGDAALRKSSEGMEDDLIGAGDELERLSVGERDVVLGIAAGGTTPYVLGGLHLAKQRGATTGMIACVDEDTLLESVLRLHNESSERQRAPQDSTGETPVPPRVPPAAPPIKNQKSKIKNAPFDHHICLPVGPEVVTGSTRMKAGTATKLALNMISTATMVRLGKTWGNLMIDLRATNAKLRDRAARILSQQCELPRGEALTLLDRADGRVKLALVMQLRGVNVGEAQRLLDEHDQQLRPILGPPR